MLRARDRQAASTSTACARHIGTPTRMSRGWKRVLELNRSRPALFNALSDGTIYLGVANALPRHAGGRDVLRRSGRGDGVQGARTASARSTDEKYRLLFVGRALLPDLPPLQRDVHATGAATFVHSTYLWFASGGANLGFQYDLARSAREPRRGRADRRARRDGQHVLPDQALRRAWSTSSPPTASSITRSRAAAPSRPGSPTAGAR